MQRVERKKKRTWKHGRAIIAAAALVLLGGSIAAALIWPRGQVQAGTGGKTAAAQPAREEADQPALIPEVTAEIQEPGQAGTPRETESGAAAGPPAQAPEETGGTAAEPQEGIPEELWHTGGVLTARDPEELASVTIGRRGEEPWTLIRDEAGAIRLKGSEDWTANTRLSYRILDALAYLVYEDVLTEDPSEYLDRLGDFGLDDPYITAEVRFTDGQEIRLRLGDEIPIEKSVRYMLIDGDDRLYAVSHSLAEDLEVEKEALHPVTQPEIYPVLLDRITVYGKNGAETAEWRLRGEITDQDAGTNWEITAPFRYCADETIIGNLKTSAGNLRMGVYMGEATEDRLAELGLKEPEYILELHMAAGSTGTVSNQGVYDVVEREGGTVRLEISRGASDLFWWVRFGDEVFRVSHMTLAAFLETVPETTAARYIVPTPFSSLESMTVERNGETTIYTLERTGETDPETAEEKIICRRNGEEIALEAFRAAYDRLMTVTVGGRLPRGSAWKEPHTKYTFRSVSGGTHTVAFSGWDGMHDAVTLDGETRFYLIERGAEFSIGQ